MKILTVCEHGSVRSVAMAYLIKTIYHHEHEVIPVGIRDISDNTLEMLGNWAEKVIVMDKLLVADIGSSKVFVADVGEDIWHDASNEELRHECLKYIRDLNL